MNISWITLFLRYEGILHLNWIEFHRLIIRHLWLGSKSLNTATLILSVLRQSHIMQLRLISLHRLLTDKLILCILDKVWISKSSVSFWILHPITNWLFVSRISSQVNEVPKWIDFHTSCCISVNPHRFPFKSDLDILLAASREDLKEERISIFWHNLVGRVKRLNDGWEGLLLCKDVSMLKFLNIVRAELPFSLLDLLVSHLHQPFVESAWDDSWNLVASQNSLIHVVSIVVSNQFLSLCWVSEIPLHRLLQFLCSHVIVNVKMSVFKVDNILRVETEISFDHIIQFLVLLILVVLLSSFIELSLYSVPDPRAVSLDISDLHHWLVRVDWESNRVANLVEVLDSGGGKDSLVLICFQRVCAWLVIDWRESFWIDSIHKRISR